MSMNLEHLLYPTVGGLVMAASYILWKHYRIRTGDVLNPAGIVALFWLGMFGFGVALEPFNRVGDESYLEEPFHIVTFVAVFAMGLLLLLGCRVGMTGKSGVTMRDATLTAWSRLNAGAYFLITVALFCAGVVGQYIQYTTSGEFPLLSDQIDTVRLTYKVQYYHYLGIGLVVVAGLGMMGFKLDTSLFRRGSHLIMSVSSPILCSLGASKSDAMSACVFMTVLYLACSRRVSRVAVTLLVVAILGGFTAMHLILAAGKTQNPYYRHTALENLFFHGPGSFKNLQYTLLYFDGPNTWGAFSNAWLRKYVYADDASDTFLGLGTANAMPAPAQLVVDFGVLGSLIYCLLCGAFAGWLYDRFLRRGNIFWLIMYAWNVWAMVQFFRTERVFGGSVVLYLTVALCLFVLAEVTAGHHPSLRRGITTDRLPEKAL